MKAYNSNIISMQLSMLVLLALPSSSAYATAPCRMPDNVPLRLTVKVDSATLPKGLVADLDKRSGAMTIRNTGSESITFIRNIAKEAKSLGSIYLHPAFTSWTGLDASHVPVVRLSNGKGQFFHLGNFEVRGGQLIVLAEPKWISSDRGGASEYMRIISDEGVTTTVLRSPGAYTTMNGRLGLTMSILLGLDSSISSPVTGVRMKSGWCSRGFRIPFRTKRSGGYMAGTMSWLDQLPL